MILKQGGFSLVSTVVAMAVGSIIVTSMASYMASQASQLSLLEDKINTLMFQKELQIRLSDSRSCFNSFNGHTVSGTAQNVVLRDENNVVVYDPSDATKNRYGEFLNIASITAINRTVPGPNSTGIINLQVRMDRRRPSGIKTMKPFVIPIGVSTGPANEVLGCDSDSDGTPTGDIQEVSFFYPGTGSNGSSTVQYLACPADRQPVSCGFDKNGATDEDEMVCRLDLPNNRCRFQVDQDYGYDGAWGYCYCIK